MTLAILKYPHPFLRQSVNLVEHFDATLGKQVDAMFKTMYEEHGCGLAANQVHYPGRVIVIDISRKYNEPMCFINPEIVTQTGEYTLEHGCLSIPGIYAKFLYSKEIELRYQDLTGHTHVLHAKDDLAACIQHEVDHLGGVLMFDRLSRLKRDRLLQKYEKLHQRNF